MKILKQGICLALLGAGLTAAPLVSSSSAAPVAAPVAASPDGSLVSQIRAEAEGRVFATTDRATGAVSFLRSKKDLMPGTSAASTQEAAAKVGAYLDKYAGVFGAKADQLTQSGVRKTAYGWTVELAQSYQGVPVFGAELQAQIDKAGQLTSVNGFVAPDLKHDVATRLSAVQAADRAMAAVRKNPPGSDASTDLTGIKPASSKLYVYRVGAIRGVPGPNVMAYAVEVSNQRNVREMVFVDANTGKVVNRYSMIDNALDRELYEQSFIPANLKWKENDTFPGTLLPDQINEVNGTGESYWLYKNAFDYDSYDDAGSKMRTVNNDPTIACPNANWNGVTTNYCDGVTSDDTVSHEWGHAYTEFTSGLVYQWQPGAMNEAYSDIWGETVDMINSRFNESPDTPRTAGQCSAFTRADVELFINDPAPIAGHCDAAPAGFGPVIGTPGITDDVVVGVPGDGCAAFTNGGAISGKFVYVDRGTCTFDTKADFAEAAGATGIIVGQNVAGPPSGMSGSANIPGLMITQAKGTAIKNAPAGTVNATMRSIGTDPVDNSYRWLSGESDPAFGGAIRDMWNPTCYGDPGKVTDAEYQCTPDDSGGVHTNSGVVNHTFALLVDGGTYNGVTVPAIGLDKAANLFWRTQTAYLGPISDFGDLATGLQASCTDLTGQPINKMDVTPNAGPLPAPSMISAPDCAAVTQAITATQLNTEPTQCNFQPLLQQGAPALTCGAGTTLKNVFTEDFEDGLAGWTAESQIVYTGGGSSPWVADATPPGGHTGGTARGVDDNIGDCTEAAGDFSSRDTIISPSFTMPANVTGAKLSFDHYVATEGGFDGGNVKVSVNGGAFSQIPLSAFVFNPYNTTLSATSPLDGQVGFSGTDGGVPIGSWGTSIINLSAIGVTAGAQVRLRLDMGRDGCGGLDGWYVDNIKVTACESPAVPGMLASTTSASPDPKKIVKGKSFKVNVTVGASGATPAGTVEIYKGTKLLATGTLANGKVTIKVSKKMAKKLKQGKNTLTAKYLGSASVAASQGDFVVKVKKKKH